MPWPIRDRDTTQYPDFAPQTRDSLKTILDSIGAEWSALGDSSRSRTMRKTYERHLIIEKKSDQIALTPLGNSIRQLLSGFESSLPAVRRTAAIALSRYQFQNPIEDNTEMSLTDVRPWHAMYVALSRLGWKLHWEEMNRVICRLSKMAELDDAISRIRLARTRIPNYSEASEQQLEQELGPTAIDDQPQARMAPLFSIAGCGGLLIEREADQLGFRSTVPQAQPILQVIADQEISFQSFSNAEEWMSYLWSETHSTSRESLTSSSDIHELSYKVNLERIFLEEILDSFSGPLKQVILGGPPGTGKSFVAQRLAEFITRDNPDENPVRFVQFHPSYGYEEFVEGREPVIVENGGMELQPRSGFLLRMIEDMRNREPYVLVIDEINRANLHRVLGEMMYLLEYRDRSINLMLRDDFSLPENLYIIATMNTVDRSLTTLDMAMYRRFHVFDLWPSSDVLRRHYQKEGNVNELGDELFAGFDRLNESIQTDLDRHYLVGHSFFMSSLMSQSELDRVWKRQMLPLLEQYFFDQPQLLDTYTRERFWY